ncbi:MAG: histidinol dehydrogenase [Dehalococcoidales bacterium]|nr:histidinol dehydrogenase [Dehalococcoidales bacterium]MDP6825054.1 histidinol dehydrogenase [Dehalococcoidales bacterium]
MKIIEGLALARATLSRCTSVESRSVSPAMKQRLRKMFGTDDPESAVRQIVDEVKKKGDAALFGLTEKIDGVKLTSLEVGERQIAEALRAVDGELMSALKLATGRIEFFHSAQRNNIRPEVVGADFRQLIRPLGRVGIYVPGGTAVYPSTVLMTAIPARMAGVSEIILATPPGPEGAVPPATLAAAGLARVDRVFRIGGAQAIAALAYGTESVPRVDKIYGPGNIFVVLAKKLVYGVVAIDGLPGPSEIMIIADDTADPGYCAADLLAQAEHDPLSSVNLVTDSMSLAGEVNREMTRQLEGLSRRAIINGSLDRGIIAVVNSIDEAIDLANLYAPEHLSLMVANASAYVDRIRNAGCIFIGEDSTVVLGDYVVGPSHVLPTGGTARFSSPLNITDFIKFINTVTVTGVSLKKLGPAAAVIAEAEGFDAHARAVKKRLDEG